MQPLISIIIPTYNEAANLASLLKQLTSDLTPQLPEFELIVSDGGSTDGTREIAEQFPVTLISGELSRGKQLNSGAEKAQGDILLFLHADSRIEGDILTDVRSAVDTGSMWGCFTLAFDAASPFYQILATAAGLRSKIFSSCYGDQGIFCKRSLFFQVGGFPKLPIMEDLCLSKALRRFSKAQVLPSRVITSSRRFQAGGAFKVLLKIQLIKILFALGVPAQRLVELYRPSNSKNNS